MSKPKRGTFDIATRNQGRESRTGLVLGDFATHKESGPGVYFYTFTHIPTGLSINVYPPQGLKDYQAEAVKHGWGAGL